MHQDKIEISFIEDYDSFQSALLSLVDISKNQLKKFLSKKELARPIRANKTYQIPIDIINNQKINPIYTGNPVRILGESEHIVAVHKPRECHSLPLKYSDTNCVQNYLCSVHSNLLEVNMRQLERGLLNRLDFETSGILLFAKSDDIYQKVRNEFHTIVTVKNYLAIVEGEFPNSVELMNHLTNSGDRKTVLVSDQGELALARAERIDFKEGKSLVKIELKTGLRHQIRVQLAHLGFPILGDILYGGAAHERLFLHAKEYALELAGEKVSFVDNDAELFSSFFDLNS